MRSPRRYAPRRRLSANVRLRVRDRLLNNSLGALRPVFVEQRGQLRSPRSEHWRATITVCAATGRLRPPRASWQHFFTTRSTAPLMVCQKVSFGTNHVRLGAVQVQESSRSSAPLPSWLPPLPARIAVRFLPRRPPSLCRVGRPNRAAHSDAREASRLVSPSQSRAGGRGR